MNPSPDDRDATALWRLTAEQRQQIFEQEKHRIEHAAPAFSKKTKVIAAVYVLGCLLLYFGIPSASLEFWSTHTWKLKPEPDLFASLGEAAITLIRPFLAVILTFWFVGFPLIIALGIWGFGGDFLSFLKRMFNRENRDDD